MALQALIQNPPVVSGPEQIMLFVQFYDDADPLNQRTPTSFVEQVNLPFLSSQTGDEITAAVVARGLALKATVAKLAAIRSTIAAPTTIAVG